MKSMKDRRHSLLTVLKYTCANWLSRECILQNVFKKKEFWLILETRHKESLLRENWQDFKSKEFTVEILEKGDTDAVNFVKLIIEPLSE